MQIAEVVFHLKLQSTASTAPGDRLTATKVMLINKKHRQGEVY